MKYKNFSYAEEQINKYKGVDMKTCKECNKKEARLIKDLCNRCYKRGWYHKSKGNSNYLAMSERNERKAELIKYYQKSGKSIVKCAKKFKLSYTHARKILIDGGLHDAKTYSIKKTGIFKRLMKWIKK